MATADTIKQYFVNILQRDPTAAESSYWVATVDSGALTLTQARDALATSPEAVTYVDQIIRIYQAAFGRKPDVTGIDGWTDQLRADPTALSKTAAGFVNSQEWKNRYGDNTVNPAVLQALYQNVLGRTGSAAEIDAWMKTGQSMTQILIGFSNSAEFSAKAAPAILAIKQAAAGVATSALNTIYTGSGALFDPATGSGQTYPLTLNQDTLTGTNGNDVFNAAALQAADAKLANSLQNVDVLDGGAGQDTLNATLAVAGDVTPTLKNIEVVNVRSTDGAAGLDLIGASGITNINVSDSTAAVAVKNVGSVANLGVKNQNVAATFSGNKATTLNFSFDTVGKSAAAADEVAVTADTGATTGNFTLNNANVDLKTVASLETVTVTATGANRLDLDASKGAIKTATVSGAGSVDLAAAFTALTKLDAAKNTGGVTATVDGKAVDVVTGSGKDSITYSAALDAKAKVDLGAGDDTFKIAAASAKGATVDGGAGQNTLAVTDGSWINADAKNVYKNFQTLEIAGGKGDYTLSNLTSVTAVTLSGAALAADANIKDAAAGVTFTVNAKADTDLTDGNKISYALKDATGKADTLSITLNALDDGKGAAAKGVIKLADVTANGIETVTINSNVSGISNELKNTSYTNEITKFSADAVATLTITGNANTTIGGDGSTFKTVTKVDASTTTGQVTISADKADSAVQFIGGSVKDTYTASAKGDSINAGKGGDVITAGGGKDTLIVKAGDSVLTAKADGHDNITGFTTGDDIIDLGAFGFTGQSKSAILSKGALANSVVDGTALSQTDFFDNAGIDRAVAWGTNGGNAYVFVDVNKDGNFTAADDLFIQLTGTAAVNLADFGF